MDNVENIISLIFSLISSVAILIYYLNPKQSTCYDCEASISHRKENRYSVTLNGEENALCKKCFNKHQKQELLPAQNCFCCEKVFTTRMKIHKWEAYNELYFLCSVCNKNGKNKLKNNFQLVEVLTDSFIEENTSTSSLQEFINSSGIKIEHQNALNSPEWHEYVIKSSKFSSWEAMESSAISELSSRHRFSIIQALRKSI